MFKELTKNQPAPWIILASTVLLASLLGGCATRHLSMVNWNSLDPGSYKAWAEDEAYEITWYQQSRQLKQLREAVIEMPRGEQVRHAEALGANIAETEDMVLQLELVRTLAVFDVPEAIPGLRQASESDIPEVRIAACRAWELQSSPERVGILLQRVAGDTNQDVRIAAMRALGTCRATTDQPRIRESLVDLLDDDDPAIQYAAAQSLEASSGLDLNTNIRLWKDLLSGETSESQALRNADAVRMSAFEQLLQSGFTVSDLMPWNWF
ncbi:MAG: HEAT repeat domain-containing protein [Planctomycetota bacterium]|nr:HEAT repeat domain-containing protein [Planctomycetota bacterium]